MFYLGGLRLCLFALVIVVAIRVNITKAGFIFRQFGLEIAPYLVVIVLTIALFVFFCFLFFMSCGFYLN